MRNLYRVLLSFYPRSIRHEFGAEMLTVFDDASSSAQSRGKLDYLTFCFRETVGLILNIFFMEGIMRHKRLITSCALAGLVLGLAGGLAWNRRPYTSVATIRVAPPFLAESFSPIPRNPVDSAIRNILQTELTRGNLSNKITVWNLYSDERRRMPMEDVVEVLRRNLHVDFPENQVRLSFTYPDRIIAQKVTADLVSRIMSDWVRERTIQAVSTEGFARRRASDAGRAYEEAMAALRSAKPGPSADRLRLDADIARQRYEAATNKAAEAELIEQVEKMQMGTNLEVLDPASLPSENSPSTAVIASTGLAVGTLLGWLVSLLRKPPSTIELPTPSAIP